jgi:hypothetical protein
VSSIKNNKTNNLRKNNNGASGPVAKVKLTLEVDSHVAVRPAHGPDLG